MKWVLYSKQHGYTFQLVLSCELNSNGYSFGDRKLAGCCCCQVPSVVSDSVRPQRRQPTRLPRPWDSPGKNTGVGCHFLLQCVKVKLLSRVRLLATPWTAAYQAPPSMGFSRQEYWSRNWLLQWPIIMTHAILPSAPSLVISRQEGWSSYSLRWSSWRVQFSNHLSRAPWLSMWLHRNALKFHSSKGSFTKRCSGKSPGIQLWRPRFRDNVLPPTCYDYHQIVWLLWVSLPHLWWG